MNDKRIIITGACGAVGSALVKDLIEFDDITIGLLDNNEEKLFWLSKDLSEHRNYKNLDCSQSFVHAKIAASLQFLLSVDLSCHLQPENL